LYDLDKKSLTCIMYEGVNLGAFTTTLKLTIGYESLGFEEPLQALCLGHAIYVEGLPIWYSK
jgi:hypothetical protein